MRISDWSSDVCSSDPPGAGTGMVGNGHPLAAFDQWPDFPAAVNDGLQPLEQRNLPRKKFRGPQPHEGRPIAALRSDDEYLGAPYRKIWEIGRASCRERECQYV